MKTPMDMVNDVHDLLENGIVITLIKGSLEKFTRLDNAIGEDIVVNALPIVGRQKQEGVVNVNIYVPNLELKLGGRIDKSQPDSERLTELASAAYFDLDNDWEANMLVDVQQGVVHEERSINAHYINIRVNYKFLNF